MAKRKVKRNGESKVPLEKRIAVIWDCCMTQTEEYQMMPLLIDNFKNIKSEYDGKIVGKSKKPLRIKKPSDYFKISDGWCVPNNGIGYLQQMIHDSEIGVLPPLTKELLNDVGARMDLSPGMPNFLRAIKEKWKERGIMVCHYIISVGIQDIIEGSKLTEHVDGIYASELYATNGKNYDRIRDPVTPFNKTRWAISIAKGDPSKRDMVLDFKGYQFDYRNCLVIGDGGSDVSVFAYLGNKGATSFGVVKNGSKKDLQRAVENTVFHNRTHVLTWRDYRRRKAMWKAMNAEISRKVLRDCNFDPVLVSMYKKDKIRSDEVRELVDSHIRDCDYCKVMADPSTRIVTR